MIKKTILAVLTVLSLGAIMLCPAFAGNTDAWLSDWDYEIKELGYDGKYIFLNKYTGTATDIGIAGMAEVNGVDYPVCIGVQDPVNSYSHYRTGLNQSNNLRQITFFSVNDVPVRSEMGDRLDDMFYGMENLEYVFFRGDFKGDVSQAISMFEGCKKLRAVDIYDLDFGYCCNYKRMFYGCESLVNVTVNCDNATNMKEMFEGCKDLEEVTINCAASDQCYADRMFAGCSSLKEVHMDGRHFSDVRDFSSMFFGCSALESIDMGMFDFSSATKLERMFYGCSKLKTVDLSMAEWGNSTPDACSMFCYCEGLRELTVPAEFKPEAANSMLFVDFDDECGIKIKGRPSNEFKATVLSNLADSNRYLGQVKLRAKVELEGKELRNGLFLVEYDDSRHRVTEANSVLDGNVVELVVPVYSPGSNTFEIQELFDSRDSILSPGFVPIEDTDEVECEDAVRAKTVNVVLQEDGELRVE